MIYQYEPLADPEGEIRLAIIQPGAFEDPLCISFITRELEHPSPCYEALSYAWGSSDDPSFVYVGSEGSPTISTTHNLDVALRHYRYRKSHRVIWIDALCIDQCATSIEEKNKQVAAMGKIFSAANSVLVWLGPEQDRSDEVLELLQRVGKHIEIVDWVLGSMRATHGCPQSEKHWANPGRILPFYKGQLTPVLDLYERPYFRRVWIRQEIALARHGILSCGSRTMDLETFRKAVFCLYEKQIYEDAIRCGVMPWRTAVRLVHSACTLLPGRYFYIKLRRNLGPAECHDPRDKIFAVLALLHHSDRMLEIRPDYSKTTEQVYTDLARQIILRSQSLRLLECCSLSSRVLAIPSWTPDWSTPWAGGLFVRWSACGWISSNLSVLPNNAISTSGVVVTQIARCLLSSATKQEHTLVMILETLRKLNPAESESSASKGTRRWWAERICAASIPDCFAESYIPRQSHLPTLASCISAIETIWSQSYASLEAFSKSDMYSTTRDILNNIHNRCRYYDIFQCNNGHIGVANSCVQEGDTVAVLLGCRMPVILRQPPTAISEGPTTWEVVGVANVTGLMKGEAIYGDKCPSHWQFVMRNQVGNQHSDLIDGTLLGLYDPAIPTLRANPAEILEEMRVKVEKYEREPHLLEVLPETLRAAGIPLQDFILA